MQFRPLCSTAQHAFAQLRSTTARRTAVVLFAETRRPSMHLVTPSNLQLPIQPMSFLPEPRGHDQIRRPIEHTGSTIHAMHISYWMASLTRRLMHVCLGTPEPCYRISSNSRVYSPDEDNVLTPAPLS